MHDVLTVMIPELAAAIAALLNNARITNLKDGLEALWAGFHALRQRQHADMRSIHKKKRAEAASAGERLHRPDSSREGDNRLTGRAAAQFWRVN